tara:strand:- start:610 stop:720 length:111 start_codon:yes stop_codon:yes gene_type:complete
MRLNEKNSAEGVLPRWGSVAVGEKSGMANSYFLNVR